MISCQHLFLRGWPFFLAFAIGIDAASVLDSLSLVGHQGTDPCSTG